jgi:phosphoglycerate kinase
MANYKTIDELNVAGKSVLVRVDYNVPIKDGKITDATRIEKSAKTILDLSSRGAKVILLSHLGRPDGHKKPEFSLSVVLPELSRALGGKPVTFVDDCIGDGVKSAIQKLPNGQILLCENVRFHAGEEKNDPDFTAKLAELGDFYVNDAFSAAHRAHASTEGLAHLLPSAVGRLLQAELDALQKTLENPLRPAMAIVGGAKVSTKVDVLFNLLSKVDILTVGGGMANTFLVAQGLHVGKSLVDKESVSIAQKILAEAKSQGKEILLPIDAMVSAELKPHATPDIASVSAIPPDKMILDVGPASVVKIAQKMAHVKTVLWNGPLGVFETPPFDRGTIAIAQEIARLTGAGKLLSVAGGGDTVSALEHAGVMDKLSYVSTAGGAFLEWLEGKELPGIAALKKSPMKKAG